MFCPLNYGQESLSTVGAPAHELPVHVVDRHVMTYGLWGQRLVDDLRLWLIDDRWLLNNHRGLNGLLFSHRVANESS